MWLTILKQQVELQSQGKVAAALGVSTAVVSQLCNEKYPGNMQKMQSLVESVYMSKMVLCPVLGQIAWHICNKHQRNVQTSNPQKLRLYKACRAGCENSSLPVTQRQNIQVQENRGYRANHYDAEAVISRLKRQAETNGNINKLAELLQAELISLAARFNRLNRGAK